MIWKGLDYLLQGLLSIELQSIILKRDRQQDYRLSFLYTRLEISHDKTSKLPPYGTTAFTVFYLHSFVYFYNSAFLWSKGKGQRR